MTGVKIHDNAAENVTYRPLNVADLGGKCSTNYLRTASLAAQVTTDLGVDPCAPNMLLPPGLDRAHSAWATCVAPNASYAVGIWDPPRALLSVNVLTPVEAKASPTTTDTAPMTTAMTLSASAGSQPTGSSVSQTSRSSAQDDAAPSNGSLDVESLVQGDEYLPDEISLPDSASTGPLLSVTIVSVSTSMIVAGSGNAASPPLVRIPYSDSSASDEQSTASSMTAYGHSTVAGRQDGTVHFPPYKDPYSSSNNANASFPKPGTTPNYFSVRTESGASNHGITPSIFKGGAEKLASNLYCLFKLLMAVLIVVNTADLW